MARYLEVTLERRGVSCIARLLDEDAPRTCAMVWEALPQGGAAYHAKYARNEIYTIVPPFGPDAPGIENPTVTPIPGDICYFFFPTGMLDRQFKEEKGVQHLPGVVDLALFYGRNEAKHSSLEPRERAPAAAAVPAPHPAAPSEAPAKAAEHKPPDAPAPEPTAADGAAALSTQVLKKKVDESMPALQGCVDQAVQRDPELRVGKVVILATVAPSGAVTSTRIDKRTVDQSPLGACLKTATRNIHFPSFNGAAIPVDIPVVVADGQ